MTAAPSAPASDPVNHPSHYTAGKIECIDAIEAMLAAPTSPMLAFLKGQVVKYVWRAGSKANLLEDLKKAEWYLKRAINDLESELRAEVDVAKQLQALRRELG